MCPVTYLSCHFLIFPGGSKSCRVYEVLITNLAHPNVVRKVHLCKAHAGHEATPKMRID